MVTGKRLVIFTEGDIVRGLGHVSRCSAYAQAWSERGGQVCWILDGDPAAAAAAGSGQFVIRRRWQEDERFALDVRPAVALVDSYVASAGTLDAVAAVADLAVFIDDLGRSYPPGIVVHPAPDGLATNTAWLEGPSWQPLRPPFWDLPARLPSQPEIERILVVLGGGDLRGIGVDLARLASEVFPSAEIDLVAGAGRPAPAPTPRLTVHQAIDATAMASLMLGADVAVTGAGQTVFELARCGTPAVLIGIADNQQANLDHWPALCGYVSAGRWDDVDLREQVMAALAGLADPLVRSEVSRRASGVVDGQGVRRLLDYLDRTAVQERVP